jgi:hypothetical protein
VKLRKSFDGPWMVNNGAMRSSRTVNVAARERAHGLQANPRLAHPLFGKGNTAARTARADDFDVVSGSVAIIRSPSCVEFRGG